MQRRDFLGAFSSVTAASLLGCHAPGWAQAVSASPASLADRVLVLVELKGGNDGLNTVVPHADSAYRSLRDNLALRSEDLLDIGGGQALHGALSALLPLWEKGELAIVQGVGYPQPNLSHFRSIEVWETASRADEFLDTGWVTRGLRSGVGARAKYTAEGVLIGSGAFGPLLGAHAVSLNNPEAFVSQARLALPARARGSAALQHVLAVENDVVQAAVGLQAERFAFATAFPQGAFGNSVRAAAQVIASQRGKPGVPVITLTLGSFDTHQNQLNNHAALLRQLGEGLGALRSALLELGAWERTLVMSFSEFGRRARPNNSGGTDHGTAAPHFVLGGAVRGGLHGSAPDLLRLDANQNLVFTTDFRQLYATVARDWWGVPPEPVVRGPFAPLNFIRT